MTRPDILYLLEPFEMHVLRGLLGRKHIIRLIEKAMLQFQNYTIQITGDRYSVSKKANPGTLVQQRRDFQPMVAAFLSFCEDSWLPVSTPAPFLGVLFMRTACPFSMRYATSAASSTAV